MPIDRDRAVRRVADLTALAVEIRDAGDHDETSWLEWKSTLDLSDRTVHGHLSRHVLGMANRDPQVAARHAGGCGYVFVGVEPGSVVGVETVDLADLEPQLLRFLGHDGPIWTPQWLSLDGHDLLALVVDPPSPGDPIHTLRRQFEKYRDGDVFVRHGGRTERATAADISMLSRRLETGDGAGSRLNVVLTPAEIEIPAINVSDDAVQEWIEGERVRLLAPLREATVTNEGGSIPDEGPETINLAELMRDASQTSAMMRAAAGERLVREDREPDAYVDEVERYLDEVAEALPGVAIDAHIESRACAVELSVKNETESPFTNVRMEVHVPGDGLLATDDCEGDRLPKSPRIWGDRWESRWPRFGPQPFSVPSITAMPSFRQHGPSVDIDNSGSATLRFSEVDVAPLDEVEVAEFFLVIGAAHAGESLTARWTARSTTSDGICSGELVIHVLSALARKFVDVSVRPRG